MKCHTCKFREQFTYEEPCRNCKHCPIGEEDCFELKIAEPVSADEVVRQANKRLEYYIDFKDESISMPGGNLHCLCMNMVRAGEANAELRHQPKQTFKEWWKYSKPADFNEENKIGAEEVWIAAIGSYGFKEDYEDPG